MIIPPNIIPYVSITMLILGILGGLWTLCGYLYFKRLTQLKVEKVHIKFLRADFQAIGQSSPYVDFYFNVHSCLSSHIILTGQKRGRLSNSNQIWESVWEINTDYRGIIKADTDTEFRIRWFVSQGNDSPMTEFAFAAIQNPPEQCLSFRDMYIELNARFLGLVSNIGWLQLPQEIVSVPVPNHIAFVIVRRNYS